ncbi:MAG: response regulator [Cyanobacteria bacterium P01_C01_bin.89]
MRTVLVVEDSQTERNQVTTYLQEAGMAVVSVGSGEEALSWLKSQTPDIILLDVILPGQSGFEVCREIKQDGSTSKDIPVVMCSTKTTNVDKTWGTMLGANAYLDKPVDKVELITTLQRLTA